MKAMARVVDSNGVTELDARDARLTELAAMPARLRAAFEGLSAADARWSPRERDFSPVEHAWHLADLEREGYALRIERLRTEWRPELADFDGARIARERAYRSLELEPALRAFEAARAANVATLRALAAHEWEREGEQAGVGEIALCDVPAMMRQHDAGHVAEIRTWQRSFAARTGA